jgi:hypothetical protein
MMEEQEAFLPKKTGEVVTMKTISAIVLSCFLLMSTGCAAFNAGPKMMNTIGEGAISIGTTLASKMNPTDMTAQTGGTISDPRFTFKGHVATGVVFDFTAQLVGADLEYDIMAGGQGAIEPDPVIINTITSIWGNSTLSEEERKNMLAASIQQWMAKKIAETKAPAPANDK